MNKSNAWLTSAPTRAFYSDPSVNPQHTLHYFQVDKIIGRSRILTMAAKSYGKVKSNRDGQSVRTNR